MDKPSKLNERLTLITNVAVVLGIVFLGIELRQNTKMMRAQIRDSITEKQMTWAGWGATNRETAEALVRGVEGPAEEMDPVSELMFNLTIGAQLREFENSHYQYEQGLFTPEEYESRVERWRDVMANPPRQAYWEGNRHAFAPSFRAELDRIVAEIEN